MGCFVSSLLWYTSNNYEQWCSISFTAKDSNHIPLQVIHNTLRKGDHSLTQTCCCKVIKYLHTLWQDYFQNHNKFYASDQLSADPVLAQTGQLMHHAYYWTVHTPCSHPICIFFFHALFIGQLYTWIGSFSGTYMIVLYKNVNAIAVETQINSGVQQPSYRHKITPLSWSSHLITNDCIYCFLLGIFISVNHKTEDEILRSLNRLAQRRLLDSLSAVRPESSTTTAISDEKMKRYGLYRINASSYNRGAYWNQEHLSTYRNLY